MSKLREFTKIILIVSLALGIASYTAVISQELQDDYYNPDPGVLVENSSFDFDVPPWYEINVESELSWSEIDAFGSATSGSAQFTHISPDSYYSCSQVGQCVNGIVPNQPYSLTGMSYIDFVTSGTSGVEVEAHFYSGEDCTSATDTFFASGLSAVVGQWVTLDAGLQRAPCDAKSIKVRLRVCKLTSFDPVTAHFDEVYLDGPADPEEFILTDSFEDCP